MIHLELLGNALGTVVMYWGAGMVLFCLWLLSALLSLAFNAGLQKITGQPRDWSDGWFDGMQKAAQRLEFRWIGWLPGLLIQVWYAGYAADLVHAESPRGISALLHVTAAAGIAISGTVFGLIHAYFDSRKGRARLAIPAAVCLVSAGGYVVLLHEPALAARLASGWRTLLGPLLGAMIDSL